MDPDANIREQAEIFRRFPYDETDRARLHELQDAYGDWRASGGYQASQEARDELTAAVMAAK